MNLFCMTWHTWVFDADISPFLVLKNIPVHSPHSTVLNKSPIQSAKTQLKHGHEHATPTGSEITLTLKLSWPVKSLKKILISVGLC